MKTLAIWGLAAFGAWYAFTHLPGGGPAVKGKSVLVDTGGAEAAYEKTGAFAQSFMLFGGQVSDKKSLHQAHLSGIELEVARTIASAYADFHLCASPGAAMAKDSMQDLRVVPADRVVRRALAEAVTLHDKNVSSGGARVFLKLTGSRLRLSSFRVKSSGDDLKAQIPPEIADGDFYLIEKAELLDAATALKRG